MKLRPYKAIPPITNGFILKCSLPPINSAGAPDFAPSFNTINADDVAKTNKLMMIFDTVCIVHKLS